MFLTMFILTVLLFAVSIFLFIKNEKYGIKPAIASSVIFIILLFFLIPLGNQPVVDEMTDAEAEQWYDENIAPKPVEEVTADVIEENEYTEQEPVITKTEFDEIKNGMTYDKVVEIVGGEGELISESGEEGADFYTVMYMYKGEGELGANANFMFQNNELQNKSQFGLK